MSTSSEERHAEIMDTAIKLFRKKNYHGTSMQDIAEAVGIYRGSLYHYINSKEEILYHIVERPVSKGVKYLKKIQLEDLPPAEKLRRAMEYHVRYSTEHQAVVAIMLEDTKHLSEECQKQIREAQKKYEDTFLNIIREGIQKGDFKKLDPKVVTFAILGMTNWMYRWFDVDGKLSAGEVTELFLDMILNGLLVE
ncbi:TetR/AcrR family transcriptional regulator [Pelotomaculum terephthalicicum JT]|uniref:TetR/AcrR family transcriptional regulator n=1 Tax=Pelotomaculum TaxID=191373 RepID=UPI0009CD3060|nr:MULTISPECIES: TetR/AcrR family transcriptional regulator [Pelotomaculum]MCG9967242.1 TetR/AcrR family transcriptional regulator [Pelotomaculum terephthalicicum JT]OPX88657.1 MAG: HTH-type transcriptional repressor KstR2 [Pelotomaculum sp. PtaB.Bin117]OPY63567.1 MAG: HTH-type transcriptional repressor KstR2 [Pelotomaculum sp. PtaU1.Bin065]